jgi:hypothetical protein
MMEQLRGSNPAVRNADYATAVIRLLGEKDVNWEIQGLHGCTVLVVLSRQAVYVAHYTEELAFSPPKGQSQAQAFQDVVEAGLIQGIVKQQQSLRAKAGLFRGGHAYLLVPTSGTTSKNYAPYQDQYDKISSIVHNLVGIAPTQIDYDRMDDRDEGFRTTPKGSMQLAYHAPVRWSSVEWGATLNLRFEWTEVHSEHW